MFSKTKGGQREKRTATFRTSREAEDWLEEQRQRDRQGIDPAGDKMTLADWLPRWLGSIRKAVANNTWAFYEFHVRTALIPQLGHVRLRELTADRIETMYADMLAASASVDAARKAGTTLSAALKKAARNRLIQFNPAREAARPAATRSPKDVIRALDPGQVARLLAAARQDRLYTL